MNLRAISTTVSLYSHGGIENCMLGRIVFKYRILTEFKVFMYWKDPPRANRGAEPRSGEALQFVRAGLSSTWTPKNEVSIRLTQRRVKFS